MFKAGCNSEPRDKPEKQKHTKQASNNPENKRIDGVAVSRQNGAVCARLCMGLEQRAALFPKRLQPKWVIHTQGNRRAGTDTLQEGWWTGTACYY